MGSEYLVAVVDDQGGSYIDLFDANCDALCKHFLLSNTQQAYSQPQMRNDHLHVRILVSCLEAI